MTDRPDALWRENLRRDADKLQRVVSRRNFLKKSSLVVGLAAIDEYVMLRRTWASFLHGGGSAPTSLSAITNSRTGTTYQFLPDAIWNAATGDTVLVPAGTSAPAHPSTPYSYWKQLDSFHLGYTTAIQNMFLAPSSVVATGATPANYLSIVGVGSASNGRAVFSPPHTTLAADFNPDTDTVMHLVDASNFFPAALADGTLQVCVWGDGSAISYTCQAFGTSMSYTGISGNDLTGVTVSGSPGQVIPAGTMIMGITINLKALIISAMTGPGLTLTNLELWGAGSGNILNAVRQWGSLPGGQANGSTTFNNCYIHDCTQGVGLAQAVIGDGTSLRFFNTEIYRGGWKSSRVHNIYTGPQDEVIFDGSYTHFSQGVHLLKTRGNTNFITYSRLSWEISDANSDNIESCCIDASNGGLTYVIGNAFEHALNAANWMIQFNAEGDAGNGELGAANASQELYNINNTMIGPANGTGKFPSVGYAPIILQALGVTRPEMPLMGQSSAGSLAARRYWGGATGVTGGKETSPSILAPGMWYLNQDGLSTPIGQTSACNYLDVSASKVLTLGSILPRTGITDGWNAYANYADPIIYRAASMSQSGNNWFWDAGRTLPVFSEAASGSQPLRFLQCGFTYQYPTGESINAAVFYGYSVFGNPIAGEVDGARNLITVSGDIQSYFQIDANNRLTVHSPPDPGNGATGWNFYCAVAAAPIDPGAVWPYTALTRQNISGAISLGTNWTEPTTGLIESADALPNWLKQNTSTIAIGTGWTEPSTGLANHNPTGVPHWRRRATSNRLVSEWWAVAPSPLTNYKINIYPQYYPSGRQVTASVVAIKGATSTTWPFASDLNSPVNSTVPATISITETSSAVIVANFRRLGALAGTAGSGYTQIYSDGNIFNSEYQVVSGPQTNFPVTQTGGNTGDLVIADAVIVGAGGGVDGSAHGASAEGDPVLTLTVSTTQSNDILILQVAIDVAEVFIDCGTGPAGTQLGTGSPTGIYQNNLLGNFYTVPTGGYLLDGMATFPSGYLTLANNIQINTYSGSGSTFNAPLFSAAFADPTPGDYDYRLKLGSSPIGAGANPGSSPEGQSLSAAYELKLFGLPTPGTPIPAKTARTDQTTPDVGAFEFGV